MLHDGVPVITRHWSPEPITYGELPYGDTHPPIASPSHHTPDNVNLTLLLLCRSEDMLPGSLIFDVVERIMGFLGPSGWTNARLVNSAFRAAVSENVRVIIVRRTCKRPCVRVHQLLPKFPKHSGITICLQRARDWAYWVDPVISPLVTHVTMCPRKVSEWGRDYCVQPYPKVLPSLTLFSNLRSLTVGDGSVLCAYGFDVLLPHLPSLQRIQMTGGKAADVRALQRMPNLVDLDVVFTKHFVGEYWVNDNVGFPKLRSLRIGGENGRLPREFLALIGRLTGLTSFTCAYQGFGVSDTFFRHLCRLTNLKSLCLKHTRYFPVHVSHLLPLTTLTGLTKLEFGMTPTLPVGVVRVLPALSGLMCLKDLKVWADRQALSELSPLHVESLHRLELGPLWDKPDAEGLAVLRRATNLTRLCFHAHAHEVDKCLGRVIGGLTCLRSLEVKYNKLEIDEQGYGTCACLIKEADLAPLMALTCLKIKNVLNEHVDMASLAASLGNPLWFRGPHCGLKLLGGGVIEGKGSECGPMGTNSVSYYPAPVSPCGAHMLGGCGFKDVDGEPALDPWAVSYGLEDKEEGYFVEKFVYRRYGS
jgi:hypothetical protein